MQDAAGRRKAGDGRVEGEEVVPPRPPEVADQGADLKRSRCAATHSRVVERRELLVLLLVDLVDADLVPLHLDDARARGK